MQWQAISGKVPTTSSGSWTVRIWFRNVAQIWRYLLRTSITRSWFSSAILFSNLVKLWNCDNKLLQQQQLSLRGSMQGILSSVLILFSLPPQVSSFHPRLRSLELSPTVDWFQLVRLWWRTSFHMHTPQNSHTELITYWNVNFIY